MWIKKIFFLVSVLMTGSFVFAEGNTISNEPDKLEVGKPAPVFIAQQIDEKFLHIEELLKKKDKLILINFWAGWCQPSQKEIPYLQKVFKEYHKKGLELICVNVDEPTDVVKINARTLNIPGYQICDLNRQISTLYKVNAIPSLFLLDPNGILISEGEELVGPKLEKTVARQIKNLPKKENSSQR